MTTTQDRPVRTSRARTSATSPSSRWLGVGLIALILAVWQVTATLGFVDRVTLPPVSEVFVSWYEVILNGDLLAGLAPTLVRAGVGLLLAFAIAVPVGILMGTYRVINDLLEPLVEIIRPIPSAAYVPVAILFFGIGDQMKIFVVFLACLFPILLNTYGGVRGVDRVLIETGQTFGVVGMRAARQIVLPAVIPGILTGVRISVGISLIVVVVAEMLAGNSGIGYFIMDKQRTFQVADMFAGIFTLGVVGYVLNFGFMQLERRLVRWR
jgi:ABC-type nitrate/sulfonate/bicarbonate transport system permease component